MLWAVFLILYIIAGFLYVEPLWEDPDNQALLVSLQAEDPLGDITNKLAFIKLMITVLWPLMMVSTVVYSLLKRAGIIKEED